MANDDKLHLQLIPMPWKICSDVADLTVSFHVGALEIDASVDDVETFTLNSHVMFRAVKLRFTGVGSLAVGHQEEPDCDGGSYAEQHFVLPERSSLETQIEDWRSTGVCSNSGIFEVKPGQNDEFTIYGERVREFVVDDREFWVRFKCVSFDWSWVSE